MIILYTLTLATCIYYDTKKILCVMAGFLFASISGYWKFKILPTKKHMMFLVYPIILGLLLKLIF